MLSLLRNSTEFVALAVLLVLIVLGMYYEGRRASQWEASWYAGLSTDDKRRISTFESGIKSLPTGGFIEMRGGLLMKVMQSYSEGAAAITPSVMFCPTGEVEVLELDRRNFERVAVLYGPRHSRVPALEAACADQYVARRMHL